MAYQNIALDQMQALISKIPSLTLDQKVQLANQIQRQGIGNQLREDLGELNRYLEMTLGQVYQLMQEKAGRIAQDMGASGSTTSRFPNLEAEIKQYANLIPEWTAGLESVFQLPQAPTQQVTDMPAVTTPGGVQGAQGGTPASPAPGQPTGSGQVNTASAGSQPQIRQTADGKWELVSATGQNIFTGNTPQEVQQFGQGIGLQVALPLGTSTPSTPQVGGGNLPPATNQPTPTPSGSNTLLAYDQSGNRVYVTPGQYYPGISLTPPTGTPGGTPGITPPAPTGNVPPPGISPANPPNVPVVGQPGAPTGPTWPVDPNVPQAPLTPPGAAGVDMTGWTQAMIDAYNAMQELLTGMNGDGEIINPDINITPEIIARFEEQAKTELGAEWNQIFAQGKLDIERAMQRLGEDYGTKERELGLQFGQALESSQESFARRGLNFSTQRTGAEQRLAEQATRGLEGLQRGTLRLGEDIGTRGERELGSNFLSSMGFGTIKTGATPLLGRPGQYGFAPAGQSRELFTPQGGVYGEQERARKAAEEARKRELLDEFRNLNYSGLT